MPVPPPPGIGNGGSEAMMIEIHPKIFWNSHSHLSALNFSIYRKRALHICWILLASRDCLNHVHQSYTWQHLEVGGICIYIYNTHVYIYNYMYIHVYSIIFSSWKIRLFHNRISISFGALTQASTWMAPPPNADLGGSNVGNVGSFWDSPYGNHMETNGNHHGNVSWSRSSTEK